MVAILCASCSPTFNWREFVPEGSGLGMAFPCKPDRLIRTLPIAGNASRMTLLSCSVQGTVFAVSYADLADPAQLDAALTQFRAAAVNNVQGRDVRMHSMKIAGLQTPDSVIRLEMSGHRVDGTGIRQYVAAFGKGARAYQATVIGKDPTQESVDTFFSGLRFPS